MKEAHRSPRLALDLGNTATKAMVWQNGQPGETFAWSDPAGWRLADERVTNLGIRNIIYSTVANVPPTEWMDKWITDGRRVVSLGDLPALPFPSRYRTPATLGQDRVAAVAGALALFHSPFGGRGATAPATPPVSAPANSPSGGRGAPCLVVDAGTCMTADLVDAAGVHRGGNISPGLRMRLRAMHQLTARLPLAPAGEPSGPVGDTTLTALQHGGQRGLAYEVEGLYSRLLPDYPGLRLLLTGGDADYLAQTLSVPALRYPHLVLRGLHHILSDLCT